MRTFFKDRIDAARQLGEKLAEYRGRHPVVLAIPRGAVPMGATLASALDGELDVVLVHKIGAPGNPELAIGAVTESGEVFLGEQASWFPVSKPYLEETVAEQLGTLKHRRELYSPYSSAVPWKNRIVILVDDGIATGQTILAAAKAVRAKKPKELVIAAPVSSPQAYDALAAIADRMVVLDVDPELSSVSQYYMHFPQVTDEEVVELLARRREQAPARARKAAPADQL